MDTERIWDSHGVLRCAVCGEKLMRYSDGGESPCVCAKTKEQRLFEAEQLENRFVFDDELGQEYLKFSLSKDDSPDSEAAHTCRAYIANWGKMRVAGNGVLFSGPIGVGKTFYAAGLINALRRRYLVSTAMFTTSSMIREVQHSNNPRETLSKLNSYDVVALDDLGSERASDFAVETLETFINLRAVSGKLLIVTTNYTRKQLANPPDVRYARIFDRVRQLCVLPIILTGQSRRIADADKRLEECKKALGLD